MADLLPGRELDVEIGKKIIKVMIFLDNKNQDYKIISPVTKDEGILPYYSTNMKHSQLLIEMLQYKGYYCRMGTTITEGNIFYRCLFTKNAEDTENPSIGFSVSHAVCLAALKISDEL